MVYDTTWHQKIGRSCALSDCPHRNVLLVFPFINIMSVYVQLISVFEARGCITSEQRNLLRTRIAAPWLEGTLMAFKAVLAQVRVAE
jgi:hypothetical protein